MEDDKKEQLFHKEPDSSEIFHRIWRKRQKQKRQSPTVITAAELAAMSEKEEEENEYKKVLNTLGKNESFTGRS